MGEADVLIFNLTALNFNERILQSKLYILKRKKPRHSKKRDASIFKMKVGTLPNMTFHRYIDVSLSRQKSEWQSYDITNSVLHCRRSSNKGESLLGVTLEVRRSKNNFRLSPFRRLLKLSSQPFLLIFSEDSQNSSRHSSRARPKNEFDAIHRLINAKAQHENVQSDDALSHGSRFSSQTRLKRSLSQTNVMSFVSNQLLTPNSTPAINNYFNNSKSEFDTSDSVEYSYKNHLELKKIDDKRKELNISLLSSFQFNSSDSELSDYSFNVNDSLFKKSLKVLSSWSIVLKNILTHPNEIDYNSKPQVRHKRSISNKLISSNLKDGPDATAHLTHPSELDYSSKSQVKNKRSISNKLSSSNPKDGPDATAHTLQTVDEKNSTISTRRDRKRNQKRRNQKKRRRNRKLPFWWTKHDSRLHSKDYKSMCKRRSLVIDFAKLGWGDWVMSPKSFNAHYCTGACSFPLIKNTDPSNHAALQSLMHALGLQSDIPAPCCVPSATSPLTLLYFDEHGSLVLKNYPDMIVKKCACR